MSAYEQSPVAATFNPASFRDPRYKDIILAPGQEDVFAPVQQFKLRTDVPQSATPPAVAQQFMGLQKVNGQMCAVFSDGENPVYLNEKQIKKMLKDNPELSGDMSSRRGGTDDIGMRNAGFYLRQAQEGLHLAKEGNFEADGTLLGTNGYRFVVAPEVKTPALNVDTKANYNDGFLRLTQNVSSDLSLMQKRDEVMREQVAAHAALPAQPQRLQYAQPRRGSMGGKF